MKKIFVIAGEASGDLHASNLVKALKQQANVDVQGWGGDLMRKEGVEVLKDYKELAFMGFVEVLANLNTIKKNFDLCKQQISAFNPDAVVLIDYPGFNLRMAKWIKSQGIKVIYYISPQVWAWKKSRVKQIKKYVDKMMVILPFEKSFYEKYNYKVDFVGHPLLDAVKQIKDKGINEDFFTENNLDKTIPIVAILPGSRKQEVEKMLPVMLNTAKRFPDYQFVLAKAPSLSTDFINQFTEKYQLKVVENKTYELLSTATAAMVTSGTATLETALFDVPQVVCYKGNYISYLIAKNIVDIKYISLVNLVLDKELVTELIQSEMNEKRLYDEMKAVLKGEKRNEILQGYKLLREKLGNEGASWRAAQIVLNELT